MASNPVPHAVRNRFNGSYRDAFRVQGSLWYKVAPPLLLLTLWSTFWVVLFKQLSIKLVMPSIFIAALSIVISFLLVFRTSNAYDRYYEGRRTWGTLIVCLRNLGRLLTFSMAPKTPEQAERRRGALNLVLAYAVATKHYLRGEMGVDFSDLLYLVRHVPQLRSASATLGSETACGNSATLGKGAASSKAAAIPQVLVIPVHEDGPASVAPAETSKAPEATVNPAGAAAVLYSNLPIELSFHLSCFFEDAADEGFLRATALTGALASVSQLVDCLTQFERILRTPIPSAYSVHLKQILVIYCLLFPFQLINDVGYWVIPITAIVVFVLFSVELIGGEIENPFGYDDNDLPIDEFCEELRVELHHMISRPPLNLASREWATPSLLEACRYDNPGCCDEAHVRIWRNVVDKVRILGSFPRASRDESGKASPATTPLSEIPPGKAAPAGLASILRWQHSSGAACATSAFAPGPVSAVSSGSATTLDGGEPASAPAAPPLGDTAV